MTDRFDAWQLALINRDQTLITLAIIAAALVLAWCLVPTLPKRLQPWVYRVYLVGGMGLYVFWLFRSVI